MRTYQQLMMYLQSETTAARTLVKLHSTGSKSAIYHSAAKVASAARQAMAYADAEAGSDLTLQPLHRYYSYLQWLKAILHVLDLTYPPSTSVLQHGISVRRQKRSAYHWAFEPVHIYKEGAIQSFAQAAHFTMPNVSLMVGDLLGFIPDLISVIHDFYPEYQHLYPVHRQLPEAASGDARAQTLTPSAADTAWISRRIAQNRKLTTDEWLTEYTKHTPTHSSMSASTAVPSGWMRIPAPSATHPWRVNRDFDGMLLLSDSDPVPPWLIHFVLLYTLASLTRYSPVEWQDIIHWQNEADAILVRQYLQLPFSMMLECLFQAIPAFKEIL